MMQREYFHYNELEEWHDGMWKIVGGAARKKNSEAAAALMRNSKRFAAAMHKALEQWPNSCRHNLTAEDTNRIAWLGHAGCCVEVGSPEENTRCGWHLLTTEEQNEANNSAQKVLDDWVAANTSEPPLLRIMKNA